MYLVHGARFQYWLYIPVGKKFTAHIKPMYLRIFLTQKGCSVAINNLLPAMHPLPSSSGCLWLQVGVFNRARLSFQWGETVGQDFQHDFVIQTVANTTPYVYIIYTHVAVHTVHTCHIHIILKYIESMYCLWPDQLIGQVEICHVLLLWNSRSRSRGGEKDFDFDSFFF